MATASEPVLDDLFVALAHPLRRRILRTMHSDASDQMSPRELAQRLKQPLSRLSYHVKVLARCEAIELAGTQPVRGSTQHFYRSVVDADWALMALAAEKPRRGRRR